MFLQRAGLSTLNRTVKCQRPVLLELESTYLATSWPLFFISRRRHIHHSWLLLFTMVCSLSSLPTGYWSVSWAPTFTPNLIFSSIIFIVTSLPSASRDSFGSLEEMQHMAPFLPQGFSVAFTRCLKQWKYYYSHPLLFNHWDNKH